MTDTKHKDGGPAFPQPFDSIILTERGKELASGWTGMPEPGMSLRDWFAGMAMNGFLSVNAKFADNKDPNEKEFAHASYRVAEAMIEAREARS